MAKEKAPLPSAAPAADKKKAIDSAMSQIEKCMAKALSCAWETGQP